MSNFTYGNELYHYGTPRMKWGIRRYQNEDGSLTEEGRLRYRKGLVKADKLRAKAVKLRSRSTDQRKSRAAQLQKTADKYALKSAKIKRAATRRFFPMNAEKAYRKMAKYDLKAARYENRASDINAKMQSEQSRAERLEKKADKIISKLDKKYGSYTLADLDKLDEISANSISSESLNVPISSINNRGNKK